MGPPEIWPLSSTVRNFTARQPSAYLVAMPKKAASHIHRMAPGPPALMAVATPTMFPVPTVAARAVHRALKESMSPSPLFSALKISFRERGRWRTCRNPSRKLRKIPVPTSSTRSGGPQTKLSIAFNTSKFMFFPLFLEPAGAHRNFSTGWREAVCVSLSKASTR